MSLQQSLSLNCRCNPSARFKVFECTVAPPNMTLFWQSSETEKDDNPIEEVFQEAVHRSNVAFCRFARLSLRSRILWQSDYRFLLWHDRQSL